MVRVADKYKVQMRLVGCQFDLMMTLDEKSEYHQSHWDPSSGEPLMAIPNFVPIHVEIFHRKSKNFAFMLSLNVKSWDQQIQWDLYSGQQKCLYNISWQSIQ